MICIYIYIMLYIYTILYIIVPELFHLDPNIAIFLDQPTLGSLAPHGSIAALGSLGLRAMML